jgi:hypothetical protein
MAWRETRNSMRAGKVPGWRRRGDTPRHEHRRTWPPRITPAHWKLTASSASRPQSWPRLEGKQIESTIEGVEHDVEARCDLGVERRPRRRLLASYF